MEIPPKISIPAWAIRRALGAIDDARKLTVGLRGPQDPVGIALDTIRDQLESLGQRLQMEQRILIAGGLPSSDRIRAEVAARLRESVTA